MHFLERVKKMLGSPKASMIPNCLWHCAIKSEGVPVTLGWCQNVQDKQTRLMSLKKNVAFAARKGDDGRCNRMVSVATCCNMLQHGNEKHVFQLFTVLKWSLILNMNEYDICICIYIIIYIYIYVYCVLNVHWISICTKCRHGPFGFPAGSPMVWAHDGYESQDGRCLRRAEEMASFYPWEGPTFKAYCQVLVLAPPTCSTDVKWTEFTNPGYQTLST